MKTYPLADRINGKKYSNIRAIWSKETRAPKKGEWFLSGSICEAYQAQCDFLNHMVYKIATLVEVRMVEEIYKVLDNNGNELK